MPMYGSLQGVSGSIPLQPGWTPMDRNMSYATGHYGGGLLGGMPGRVQQGSYVSRPMGFGRNMLGSLSQFNPVLGAMRPYSPVGGQIGFGSLKGGNLEEELLRRGGSRPL